MGYNNSTTINTDRERGKHLTFEDRCSIKVFKKMEYSLRAIADAINCSASTVMNELKRGTGERNGDKGRFPEYSAKRGQKCYENNRANSHKNYKISADNPFVVWAIQKIKVDKWSIDSCVGYARVHDLFPSEDIICTKSFYNAVWRGLISLKPSDLPEALSRKPKKEIVRKNKKHLGRSIEERAAIVSERKEIGHWEIDTVVGKKAGRESVVLTLVEKVTDYYIAIKIPGKDPISVMTALDVLREEYGEEYFSTVFKTITADNGSEFSELSTLEAYGTKIYFAHPYSSWERAQNERHNRLFRRYIPKGVSIEDYSSEQILSFADSMNALPRKILGYSTPEDLFDAFLDQVYSVIKVRCC